MHRHGRGIRRHNSAFPQLEIRAKQLGDNMKTFPYKTADGFECQDAIATLSQLVITDAPHFFVKFAIFKSAEAKAAGAMPCGEIPFSADGADALKVLSENTALYGNILAAAFKIATDAGVFPAGAKDA